MDYSFEWVSFISILSVLISDEKTRVVRYLGNLYDSADSIVDLLPSYDTLHPSFWYNILRLLFL